jgi:hypothetical protein
MKPAKTNWILPSTLFAACMTLFAQSVFATPVQWSGNGHWYELVLDASSSWDQANAIATSSGGYLVTITSPGEQTFIDSLLSASACPSGGYWIGLKWTVPNTPGTWGWASGEAFSYTNWGYTQGINHEPNNGWGGYGSEDRGEIYWTSDSDYQRGLFYRRGMWNDVRNLGWSSSDIPSQDNSYDIPRTGFIIEVVPEPSTFAVAALGMIGLLVGRWMRR